MITNLVIGSEGFIGKTFCKYLTSLGEKVIPFDIKRDKVEDGRIYKFNFRNIDRVYFLAWDVGGSKYLYQEKNQLQQLHWNLKLLTNVMSQVEIGKVRCLFVSSQLAEEYDTVYGVTKKLGEVWSGLVNCPCVRIWNAFGLMETQNIKSHVISDFVYQAVKHGNIKMQTTGEEWRQFTHIDDICRGFHLALNSDDLKRPIYDLSSFEWVQIKYVAEIICKLTGSTFSFGKKSGHSTFSTNMGRLPGWLPSVTLKEGIRRMIIQAKKLFGDGKLT